MKTMPETTRFPFRRLGRAGVAAVEMGMVAPVLIAVCAGISDCSLVFHDKLELTEALSAGAEYAFTKGQSETGSTLTTDVTGFVSKVSTVALSSVTATYYGGATSTSYYCVSAAGVFTGSYAQGQACTDGSGSTAGQFVTISGSFAYKAVFPTDRPFLPGSYSQTVVVRLD